MNLATEKASVRYVAGTTSVRNLEKAVEDAGYGAVAEDSPEADTADDAHEEAYKT